MGEDKIAIHKDVLDVLYISAINDDKNLNISKERFEKKLHFILKNTFYNKLNQNKHKLSKRDNINFTGLSFIKTSNNNIYILCSEIGKGTYGKVRSGINIHTGAKVAIKILKSELLTSPIVEKEERLLKEVKLLRGSLKIIKKKTVDKYNLYKFNMFSNKLSELLNNKESSKDIEYSKKYLVMNLAEKCIPDFIRKNKRTLNSKDKIILCKMLIDAVKLLHSLNILHLDIKPANVGTDVNKYGLIKKIFLFDFGFSCKLDDKQEYSLVTTFSKKLIYHPKEFSKPLLPIETKYLFYSGRAKINQMLSEKITIKDLSCVKFSKINKASDIFMLGNVLYFILSRGYMKLNHRKYDICYKLMGKDIESIINKMTSSKVEYRPSIADIEYVFKKELKKYAHLKAMHCVDDFYVPKDNNKDNQVVKLYLNSNILLAKSKALEKLETTKQEMILLNKDLKEQEEDTKDGIYNSLLDKDLYGCSIDESDSYDEKSEVSISTPEKYCIDLTLIKKANEDNSSIFNCGGLYKKRKI